MGQASKPQQEDTSDVFEGFPSHLVLENKHFCIGWECTLLPRFIMKVKSEWMKWISMFICLLECFCMILKTKCEKKITIHGSIKILILLKNHFLWVRIFLLNYLHVKMLTFNFDSSFLRSITFANFHQILKVRIVSKSELSWLSKNVKNFNYRYPRSWEIAFF